MLALFTLAAFEAVMPLPEAFRLLGQVQAAAKRLFAIIDRPAVVSEPETAADKPAHFQLDFEQVTLRYRPHAPAALRDISLSLAPAKKLAIIGPTGAGKSSLIQLLLRYRVPESGSILLGKRPLQNYRSEQLHEWFAIVPQKVHLFNTTIRNNLLLACADASRQALDRACQIAQLDDFIKQQPQGYDTWVGETGIKLSGGQARRIAIARALLRDFECLILDEPGEGLDRRTEQDLIAGLIRGLGNKSLILITHSQTGLDRVDEIMVLENGVCIERGDYQTVKHSWLSRTGIIE
jgi:ATP-binding cassette subfamily C protein CydC